MMVTKVGKMSEVHPGHRFRVDKTPFMKLPPNLFEHKDDNMRPVNAFQEGGGPGCCEATFIPEDTEIEHLP
jgi:hypothetical protein